MTVALAVIQHGCGESREENRDAMVSAIVDAIAAGADIVLPPELFEGRYFPQYERQEYFSWATAAEASPAVMAVQKVTAGTGAVVPVSFFEAAPPSYYNSVALVEDGVVQGIYRKAHIPDGPGYEEKFYFTPGGTGFRTWPTRHGRIGVAICWDQWFPEAARIMALQGADLLLYPTAIGNEVGSQADNDTADMWRRAMDGHAVCNHVPVAAANRVGTEDAAHLLRVVLRRRPPWPAAGPGGARHRGDHLRRARLQPGGGRPCRLGPLPRPAARSLRWYQHDAVVSLRPVGWVFVLFGIFWGGWAVAAANVERALHLSDGGFGLLLSLSLVGAAASNAVGGTLCQRFGTGKVLGTSLLAWSVFLGLGAIARVPLVLELLIIVMVATAGLIDIAINVAATAALADTPGRLVAFHARFNGGAAAGAALTGVLLGVGASWRWLWVGVALAALVLGVVCHRDPLPAGDPGDRDPADGHVLPPPP